jgi:alanine racemase
VDLDAVRHNATVLRELAAPALLCAVVKADGYGHGAVAVARAALDGGANGLAVALVEEGVILREAGLDAAILLLSEPPADAMADVVAHRLTPTVYTTKGVEAVAGAAGAGPAPVHVKVDTGMHRVGAAINDAVALARAVRDAPALELEGFWTHLAVADEPGDPYTSAQLERFDEARRALLDADVTPKLVHAANSAGAIAHPAARYDMVRCGIALYGEAPSAEEGTDIGLRPALSLKARVSFVKPLAAGERVSYGLRWGAERDTVLATVPLGYADGVTRRLSAVGGEVLIGGRRCPIAGTVTMDQITVDCGPDASVSPGEEVVLIGPQGGETVTAAEWAGRLDTISYEVLCGIGPRVPRVHLHQ